MIFHGFAVYVLSLRCISAARVTITPQLVIAGSILLLLLLLLHALWRWTLVLAQSSRQAKIITLGMFWHRYLRAPGRRIQLGGRPRL